MPTESQADGRDRKPDAQGDLQTVEHSDTQRNVIIRDASPGNRNDLAPDASKKKSDEDADVIQESEQDDGTSGAERQAEEGHGEEADETEEQSPEASPREPMYEQRETHSKIKY